MLPEGLGVAVGAQGGQDGRHHLQHRADVFLGAGQDRLPPRRRKLAEMFHLQIRHSQVPPFSQKLITPPQII